MKEFTVYVKQHYEPITVMACDQDDAEYQVQTQMSWGEPIDVEITADLSSDNRMINGVNREQHKPIKIIQGYKHLYEELCDLIKGDSPNWTHEEIKARLEEQVDALIEKENKV